MESLLCRICIKQNHSNYVKGTFHCGFRSQRHLQKFRLFVNFSILRTFFCLHFLCPIYIRETFLLLILWKKIFRRKQFYMVKYLIYVHAVYECYRTSFQTSGICLAHFKGGNNRNYRPINKQALYFLETFRLYKRSIFRNIRCQFGGTTRVPFGPCFFHYLY